MYTKNAYPYLPIAFIATTLCLLGGLALFATQNITEVFFFIVIPFVALLAVCIGAVIKGKDPKVKD
ncbi:MAG TPA: hypothetical protein ENI23_11290 [bacterium]|nr:hypothetical protein [bacterium]